MANRKNKAQMGLTDKQWKFVNAYALGIPNCLDCKGVASMSYKFAYSADGMKPSSIYKESCVMLDSPKITQAIQSLQEERQEKHQLSSVALREKALDGLILLAESASSDQTRLRAYELMGKVEGVGLFEGTRIESNQTLNIKTTEEELQESIASAINNPDIIRLFEN